MCDVGAVLTPSPLLQSIPALDRAFEPLLRPLDALRAQLLQPARSLVGPLSRDRDLRVALWGAMALSASLLMVIAAPAWMLGLGPLVLGTGHILSDVRYLWVRTGFFRRPIFWGALLVAAAVGLSQGGIFAMGLGAGAVAAVATPGAKGRRGAAALTFAALAVLAATNTRLSDLVFAHAHNFIALGLWWAWRPRGLTSVLPLAVFTLGLAVLCWIPLSYIEWVPRPETLSVDRLARSLAPGVSGDWKSRLVLIYAFAQSAHYVVWLRLIPEDDRPRTAPRGFVSSYRALVKDVGSLPLLVTLVTTLVFCAWGLVHLGQARHEYLRFSAFHGQLELIAIAVLLAAGSRPQERVL